LASANTQGGVPVERITNCPPTTGGTAKGNLNWSQNNVNYALTFFSTTAGSLATVSSATSAFNVNWGNFSAPASFAKSTVAYGTIGAVNTGAYRNFATNQAVFVADIGGGVSVTALDAQGKTVGTAVFYK